MGFIPTSGDTLFVRKQFALRMFSIGFVKAVILALATQIVYASDSLRVQFCWTIGRYDQTAYFAEATDRPDRSLDFIALLDISGLEPSDVQCARMSTEVHTLFKQRLFKEWSDLELEIVNTTFMSDFDN